MSAIELPEVEMLLGVVVERRPSTHQWADWIWKPVGVFSGAALGKHWEPMLQLSDCTRFHASTMPLVLHRKETEAYIENLRMDKPAIFVILQESERGDPEYPWEVHQVTASPYEAQDYEDSGDGIIEKVPMPEEVAAFIQTYIERHHVEEQFIKRKRDRLKLEDQKFGKHPIFESPTKH